MILAILPFTSTASGHQCPPLIDDQPEARLARKGPGRRQCVRTSGCSRVVSTDRHTNQHQATKFSFDTCKQTSKGV